MRYILLILMSLCLTASADVTITSELITNYKQVDARSIKIGKPVYSQGERVKTKGWIDSKTKVRKYIKEGIVTDVKPVEVVR